MSGIDFPIRYTSVREWANQQGVSVSEAERRYCQYLILQSISGNQYLRNELAFKGGNALEFVYLPNRSTTDLDFSFLTTGQDADTLQRISESELGSSLVRINDGFGTILRLQSLKKNPPHPDAQFPTFTARIGYALPEQLRQRDRLLAGEPGANVIPVEMTLNEIVCEWSLRGIGDGNVEINVSSINDIVAEKLRAVLQQIARNRYRSQDVLDIAGIKLSSSLHLDLNKVAEFLQRKSAARNVQVSKSAFHQTELRRRSAELYGDLSSTTRHTFIPFDEAWEIVMQLVDSLDIPA